MSMPFYVAPEQQMKDKADYARKGIARGRSAVVLQYEGGILMVADNMSRTLHKISEIYDRIGFAAVGRYPEFENLRLMGVRFADVRGYQFDRRDVSGRQLANIYAQTLGTVFSESSSPGRSRSSSPRSATPRPTTRSTASPSTAPSSTSRASSRWAVPPSTCPPSSRTGSPRTLRSVPP